MGNPSAQYPKSNIETTTKFGFAGISGSEQLDLKGRTDSTCGKSGFQLDQSIVLNGFVFRNQVGQCRALENSF